MLWTKHELKILKSYENHSLDLGGYPEWAVPENLLIYVLSLEAQLHIINKDMVLCENNEAMDIVSYNEAVKWRNEKVSSNLVIEYYPINFLSIKQYANYLER